MGRIFYGLNTIVIRRTYNSCSSLASTAGGVTGSVAYPPELYRYFQSVGVNSTIEYEQLFELGRVGLYENLDGLPVAEITVEKAMDDEEALGLFRQGGGNTSAIEDSTFQIEMELRKPGVGGCGAYTASGFVNVEGAIMTNYSMNWNVEGPLTESATYEAYDIGWSSGNTTDLINDTNGLDAQQAYPDTSGIRTREHATEIRNPMGGYVQSVTFSVDLSREDVFTLGNKTPTIRSVQTPLQCTAEFECVADSASAYGLGFSSVNETTQGLEYRGIGRTLTAGVSCPSDAGATVKWLKIPNAYLTNTTYNVDTGGGNATINHTFTNYGDGMSAHYRAGGTDYDY